ncbi:M16 family metallopeptidase [Chryseobacterium sp. A301]
MTQYEEKYTTDANGYTYEWIENDAHKVRLYTLKNGLQVYLASNSEHPRIQTYIAVRTGSNRDPKDNTGLAHYLEHMLFKGTSKIGTLDWEKESLLINQISELYEEHKKASPENKKEIYKQIDALSHKASSYAIAGEYDKLVSSLGATGTNAHTWLDETVYKNAIPSNELERWLKVERERFGELVLRLFHTELETVYEEFNRAQDQDSRQVNDTMMSLLFPTHPNGQQTTLGKAVHLKNPSMKAIHAYFDQYYVPNNYAMVLVGDLQFEETIEMVDQYFGTFTPVELPDDEEIVEQPLTEIQTSVIQSPSSPRLHLGWRTPSYGTRAYYLVDMISSLLTNRGEVGLLDLDVNNKQKALYAGAYAMGFKHYGMISLVLVPKENQSLEQGKALLFEALEKIKKGEFPDWMLWAIVNDFKLQQIKGLESSDGLATNLYQTYIRGQSWKQELEELSIYESITKQEIMEFANEFFIDNYVEIFKEKGANPDLIRVENPGITPVELNQEAQSEFAKSLLHMESSQIEPEFIDYKAKITTRNANGKTLSYVKNPLNERAQLFYIFPMGKDHDKTLELAIYLLQYLGTSKYSNEALKLEFFKLGITFDFQITSDELSIVLSGLEQNLNEGIRLLNHWIKELEADQNVYLEFVQSIVESREVAKNDKGKISSALRSYAKFGKNSRLRDVISKEDLEALSCVEIVQNTKSLFSFPYELFFYGNDLEAFVRYITPFIEPETRGIPKPQTYDTPKGEGILYFVNYDMVQVELSKVGRSEVVNPKTFGIANVFNEYFGSGLSSIVFQEIRERKSLAYSAYAQYQTANRIGEPDYLLSFLGTQSDKLSIALNSMDQLMKELPYYKSQFESSKSQALKRIASGRIRRSAIFSNHHRLKKLGVDYDIREEMYKQIESLTFEQLASFYQDRINGLKYNMALIGNRKELDFSELETLGTVVELDLDELFNF